MTTPDEAAVERVARAIWAVRYGVREAPDGDPTHPAKVVTVPLDEAARAALAAMVPATPYIMGKLSAADLAALDAEAAKPGVMIAAPVPRDAALIADLRDKLQIALSFAEHPEFKTVYNAQQMEVPRDVWIDETTRWLDSGPPASRRAQGAGA